VHYWADLQSVHGFRCYDNSAARISNRYVHDSIANPKCQRVHALLVLALCVVYRATVCKTVRLMLSDRCKSVCLSVTLVYCGQTVGRIKMELGMQVGLGPGHIVLDGDPDSRSPPLKKGGTASPERECQRVFP